MNPRAADRNTIRRPREGSASEANPPVPSASAAPEQPVVAPAPPPVAPVAAPAATQTSAPEASNSPAPRSPRASSTRPSPELEFRAPAERASQQNLDGDALLAELAALGAGELDQLLRGQTARRYSAGDRVSGTVVRVGADTVFVDIGAKSEALLDLGELEGAVPATGEPISAFVLSVGGDGIRLARRLSGRAGLGALEEARDAGIPVEGRVESRNTGGFTVRVAGAQAFCPVSQIDRHPESDLDRYVGLVGMFMVKDIRGKDVIVSRRQVLEQEAEENAVKLWATVREGDALDGVVVSAKEYGLFIDVGGIQGLLHRSELSWDSDATPPARGERISVRVVDIDREAKKLSLSTKDPSLSPWSRVGRDFFEGEVYPAKITRLSAFGAFATLAPGLEGLIHISNQSKSRVEHPAHIVQPGQEVRVRILSADHERQRLDLGMKQAEEGWEPEEGERRKGSAAPKSGGQGFGNQSLGTMADLLGGLKLPTKSAAPPPEKAAPKGTKRR